MTARVITGTLPAILQTLYSAPRGMTVRDWIDPPAVYPDCEAACKAAHDARTREGRADIHAEPGHGGWVVYMEPRVIMREGGNFTRREGSRLNSGSNLTRGDK